MQPERAIPSSSDSADSSGCRRLDASLKIERRRDGKLWAEHRGRSAPVTVVRCFPWSAPNENLSLRDESDEELAFVTSLKELDEGSRAALEETLSTAGFVLDVERVEDIDEDFELRCWKVVTRQGPRSFQTERDVWPRQTPNGDLLIEDVAGDLFRIPSPAELDKKSRKLLFALVD